MTSRTDKRYLRTLGSILAFGVPDSVFPVSCDLVAFLAEKNAAVLR
jgi:hypothetical protein